MCVRTTEWGEEEKRIEKKSELFVKPDAILFICMHECTSVNSPIMIVCEHRRIYIIPEDSPLIF